MSIYKSNKNEDFADLSEPSHGISFTITENIQKLGIKELTLEKRDFLITWSSGKQNCIDFSINYRSASLSQNIKLIEKRLKDEAKKGKKIDNETVENALIDIEDQLIKKREEIYNLNKPKTSENNSDNEYKSKFLKDINSWKERFEKSSDPYREWQREVEKRYNDLKNIITNHYPEAWPIMEFCLAVKSIQNIHGNTLPFIGIILAKPSSLKTTIIELFRKYDKTFYSDSFTPNSMISHNSSLSEEQLQNVDMLPKMSNKFVLTPELAPIFTAKDDDLQKVLGIITRIVDGKGYESDSGAQGHRKYSDIMFSWVGAAVEIQPKVWKLLSQLGFKIYFFRPILQEKSVNDITIIINDNDYTLKNNEIQEVLLDYLKVFDAVPITDYSYTDENHIIKIKWNSDLSKNDTIGKEQAKVLEYIAQIANLLAHLRGTVFVSQSKTRKYQKSQDSSNNNEGGGGGGREEEISFQTEELDYETDSPIIEDPSRAAIVLRNLAIANSYSKGRNSLAKEDVKLIIQVALSTTRIHRSKILDLLLKNNGELITSKIVNELGMSEHIARKTMREFQALGIGQVMSISNYGNSELKLQLNKKFNWFLTEEFQSLKKLSINIYPDLSESIYCDINMKYQILILKNLGSNYYNSKACDNNNNNCHTLKTNLPPETDIKNNYNNTNNEFFSKLNSIESTDKEINFSHNENKDNKDYTKNIEYHKKQKDIEINTSESIISSDEISLRGSSNSNLQKNSVSLGSENLQHVTLSHESYDKELEEATVKKNDTNINAHIINEILSIIKNENGAIELGSALKLTCQKSEVVKDFLRDEKKLTQRESKKVRNIFLEINRHPNIKTLKRKPELVVKWITADEEKEMIKT